MAITVAAFPAPAQDLGPDNRRGGRISEWIEVTGSTGIVGDQASSYRLTKVHKNPKAVGGALVIASSSTDLAGCSVVIEARVALANNSALLEIIGDN